MLTSAVRADVASGAPYVKSHTYQVTYLVLCVCKSLYLSFYGSLHSLFPYLQEVSHHWSKVEKQRMKATPTDTRLSSAYPYTDRAKVYAEQKRVSGRIDKEIDHERIALRKKRRGYPVLLVGPSESGALAFISIKSDLHLPRETHNRKKYAISSSVPFVICYQLLRPSQRGRRNARPGARSSISTLSAPSLLFSRRSK